MLSAGGQVPTDTDCARFGQCFRYGEAESSVIRDAGDERPAACKIDIEHAEDMPQQP